MFPRMSDLHRQEQFSSVNGKTEQQRSLRGGNPERRPDCGHVSRPYPCLCSVFVQQWLDSMHNYWSVDYSNWQVLVKDVYSLKVIFDRLLGHSAQKKFICYTLTQLRPSVRAYCPGKFRKPPRIREIRENNVSQKFVRIRYLVAMSL